MKKIAAMIFCLLMLILCFSGCATQGNDDTGSAEATAERGAETSSAEPSPVSMEGGEEDELDEDTEEVLPAFEWVFDTPENHNMDRELLNAMHSALTGTQVYSVLTVKDGVIVDEYYHPDYDETSVFRFNSCSKSFTSALIGIAIDEGLIEGVDVPIAEYFPQVIGTDKEDITIRHLLEHTSGIEWYEFSSATSFWGMNDSDNWVDFVLEQPVTSAPGTTFTYTTGGTHLLAAILEQATDETMFAYAQRHLFAPLSMDSVHWRADPQGILDGGNGIEMTARDAAKFGQLFLNGGSWDGRQLVPANWVAESTGVQVSRDGNYGSYGYQWWIRRFAGYDAYYAMGAFGQFIAVVPELDLVAVITSMSNDTADPYVYISDYIVSACN